MNSILGGNTKRPDISFHRSGRITISARVSKMLGLETGDTIDIALFEGEYYLHIRHKSSAATNSFRARCFPSNKGKRLSNHMRTSCKAITNEMFKMCATEGNILLFSAGEPSTSLNGIKMAIPIITRANLSKQQ